LSGAFGASERSITFSFSESAVAASSVGMRPAVTCPNRILHGLLDFGDRANAILGCDGIILVNVYLADLDLPIEFTCKFIQDGGNRFAGAAPWRPEIHEDWGVTGYGALE